jgi:WD40 repeat protein
MLPGSAPATLPSRITSIGFTDGGGCLAATVSGDAAQVFDVRSGKPVTTPLRHDGQPVQIARLSPNGKLLATASGGTKLASNCEIWPRFRHYGGEDVQETAGSGRVWEVATGNPLTPPLIHPKAVLDVCFDAKSALVATASEDGTVRVCDARTGKDVAAFPKHDSPVLSVRFSPDGKRLLAASTPLLIWDVASGERVSIPTIPKFNGGEDEHGQGDRVIAAEYSPDGQQIAAVISGTDDDGHQVQHVQLLTAATGQPTPEKSESVPVISAICFDPPNTRVLVAYAAEYRNKDDTAGIDELDPETGKARSQHPMYGNPVSSIAVLAGNEDLLTATIDRTIQLRRWDYNGQEIRPANPLKFRSAPRHIECALSGAQFAVVFGNGGESVQLWNAPTGAAESQIVKVSVKLPDTPLMDSERTGRIADTSRDSKRVLKFDSENSLIVCDARTGSRISGPFYAEGGYEGGGILTAKFSPKGDLLAIGEGGDFRVGKGYARIWDAKTGRPVTTPLVHTLAVTQLVFTEDAQRLFAVASDFPRSSHLSGRLWDVRTGIALGDQTPLQECELMSFEKKTGQITGYSEGVAKVWDATFPPHAAIPEWFALFIEIIGGSRLNADTGAIEPVTEQWSKLQALRAELAATTRQDPFTVLGKWFLGDSEKRMLSPYSKETRREYIERCLAEGSELFLNEAQRLAAGDPKILERIKTKREEP